MPKRGSLSLQSLALKKQKIADECAQIAHIEEEKNAGKLLGDLISKLVGKPELIKKCITHVDNLVAGKVTSADCFPDTYIYVSKVPKDWSVATLLPTLSPALTPAKLQLASTVDKRVDQKLHYLGLAIDSKQKS